MERRIGGADNPVEARPAICKIAANSGVSGATRLRRRNARPTSRSSPHVAADSSLVKIRSVEYSMLKVERSGQFNFQRSTLNGKSLGRAVSRILSARPARASQGENHLSEQPVPGTYPAGARNEAGRFVVPYLALLPMGFSVPRRLLFERWALTPPFHPYPLARLRGQRGGMFSVALSVEKVFRPLLPGVSRSIQTRVTRHHALWSSDFPPPV